MERPHGTVMHKLTRVLELPPDVVLDLPKATIIGNVQLLIENHLGLLAYDPQRIRVRTTQGEIVVTGHRLRIGSIVPRELVVDGHISHVELRR